MAEVPGEGQGCGGDEPVRLVGHDAAAPGVMIEVVPNGAWAVQVLLCVTFPAVEEQVRDARRAVRRVLAGQGGVDAGDVELVVSELAGNAVRHSGSRVFTLELARTWSGAVRVVLVDEGRGSSTPHLRAGDPSDLGGRGLRLVNELAKRWGVVRERGGRLAVWCELGGSVRPVTDVRPHRPSIGLRQYGRPGGAVPRQRRAEPGVALGRW